MRIVYFVHCYPPARGGLEYLSSEIVRVLKEAGHHVDVVTGQGQTLDSYKTFDNWVDESDETTHIHRLSLNFFWQRIANKFLNRLIFISGSFSPWYFGPILKYPPLVEELVIGSDLIIGAGMPTKMIWDAHRLARRHNKRFLVLPAYHDVAYYNKSFFFREVLDSAEKIICSTPYEKNGLIANYPTAAKKIVTITYCPYDKKAWASAEKKLGQKVLDLKKKIASSQPIVLGYIGQISVRKNLSFFINFIKDNPSLFARTKKRVRVLVAGAKTNSSKLLEADLQVHGVEIIYDFPDSVKDDIIKTIDVLVNPSLEESLGISNFEAMIHGLPIVVNSKSAFTTITRGEPAILEELSKLAKGDKYFDKSLRINPNHINIDTFKSSILSLIENPK